MFKTQTGSRYRREHENFSEGDAHDGLRAMFWIHFLDLVFAHQRKSKPRDETLMAEGTVEDRPTLTIRSD
jgi:hypothetical protein